MMLDILTIMLDVVTIYVDYTTIHIDYIIYVAIFITIIIFDNILYV